MKIFTVSEAAACEELCNVLVNMFDTLQKSGRNEIRVSDVVDVLKAEAAIFQKIGNMILTDMETAE